MLVLFPMADWNKVRYDPSYPEPLDPEIVPLCDALNAARFVTTASCCGHGKAWPHVWFEHSTDERIESVARFVKERERGDFRPHFSMWQKEILEQGYAWSVEIHLNNAYGDTPAEDGLRMAVSAISEVTRAITEWASS